MNFILNKLKIIRKRIRLILILSITIAVASFVYKQYVLPAQNEEVKSAKVKRGDLEKALTISGEIDADEKVTLRFQTSGRLAWVGVKEGDYVKKYQSIASLDQQELNKKLQKELNDYMNERWDFEQTTKDDYRDEVFTHEVKRVFEKAQFDLDNTVLDVEIQDLAVKFANLWSPIEGIVTKIDVPHAGTNITPAGSEFEIVNPKTVFFSATVDQTEVVDIIEGMRGELILDSYPEEAFTGTIKNISFIPKTGETGTVYSVKFVFSNIPPSEKLLGNASEKGFGFKYRVGMTGDLSFVAESKENVLYLPVSFISQEDGKSFVKVKKDEKQEKVYIETGMETEDEVEIIAGVSEGEIVYE